MRPDVDGHHDVPAHRVRPSSGKCLSPKGGPSPGPNTPRLGAVVSQPEPRQLQGSLALLLVSLTAILPFAGWIAGDTNTGRISATDQWTEAEVNGFIAQTFAVILFVSIVINLFVLWCRNKNGATYSRQLFVWLAILDIGGLAWVGGLFLPIEAQTVPGLVSGAAIAVGFIGVLVVVCLGRAHASSSGSPAGLGSQTDSMSAGVLGRTRRRPSRCWHSGGVSRRWVRRPNPSCRYVHGL
ncbi:MAG: hypothetical protein JWP75_3318 [Frondihabitans sp.]|nr:hypothetical protein [Frondihabitans sp.]